VLCARSSTTYRTVPRCRIRQAFRSSYRGLSTCCRRCWPQRQHESLDGTLSAVTRKIGPREIEVIGFCVLMSDQSLAPVYVRLCISSEEDEIASIECRVGEPGDGAGGLHCIPYDSQPRRLATHLASVGDRATQTKWVYTAGIAPRST